MNTPGKLIVFEGIDGTGKSTQLPLLADTLRQRGYTVVATREPTDGNYGQQIRRLYTERTTSSPEEELALFIADRKEHVAKVITPALQRGDVVLCDRYYFSTAAYQAGDHFTPEEILRQNAFAPEPDLALIFEQPVAVSLARITKSRGEQLNDFEQEQNLQKVSAVFTSLDMPCIRRINATEDIKTIHHQVVATVTALLGDANQCNRVGP